MRFTVRRKEIWIQEISVEAPTPEEARQKAAKDDGEMREDPQFQRFHHPENWEVNEESGQ
jgi:hypothetical protein